MAKGLAGLALSHKRIIKQNKEKKEKKERLGEKRRKGIFSPDSQNMLVPRKIERGMIERFKFKLI